MSKRSKKPNVTAGGRMSGGVVRPAAGLRIIGGQFRGRRLNYSGDLRTRPMKDRLREAIFNLIGPAIRGKHAIDLFAGTGALALEAISRGADRATLIEQHNPTADIIRRNIAELGLEERAEVVVGNTFIWWKLECKRQGDATRLACHAHACRGHEGTVQQDVRTASVGMARAGFWFDDTPWAVFCSPPYDFYVERIDEMLDLLTGLIAAAPEQSVFVVEADGRFDVQRLPDPQAWDVRTYHPAVVGIFCRGSANSAWLEQHREAASGFAPPTEN
jgi:16S rRNA (guanine966-N2)-methyltransferase